MLGVEVLERSMILVVRVRVAESVLLLLVVVVVVVGRIVRTSGQVGRGHVVVPQVRVRVQVVVVVAEVGAV